MGAAEFTLDGKVSQSSKTLDGYELATENILLAHGIENCDSSTENGAICYWVDIGGNSHHCFFSQ